MKPFILPVMGWIVPLPSFQRDGFGIEYPKKVDMPLNNKLGYICSITNIEHWLSAIIANYIEYLYIYNQIFPILAFNGDKIIVSVLLPLPFFPLWVNAALCSCLLVGRNSETWGEPLPGEVKAPHHWNIVLSRSSLMLFWHLSLWPGKFFPLFPPTRMGPILKWQCVPYYRCVKIVKYKNFIYIYVCVCVCVRVKKIRD